MRSIRRRAPPSKPRGGVRALVNAVVVFRSVVPGCQVVRILAPGSACAQEPPDQVADVDCRERSRGCGLAVKLFVRGRSRASDRVSSKQKVMFLLEWQFLAGVAEPGDPVRTIADFPRILAERFHGYFERDLFLRAKLFEGLLRPAGRRHIDFQMAV